MASNYYREAELSLLKEKLQFMESQLHERDLQLEHYKSIVNTLQQILVTRSETSRSHSRSPASSEDEYETRGRTKTIVGRKQVSFHDGVTVHYIQPTSL